MGRGRLGGANAETPKDVDVGKGHQGVKGNEDVDRRAGVGVEMGRRLQKTVIATPAGMY